MGCFDVFHGFASACVHLSGEDALSYLQKQMTVALPNPEEGKWAYGLWLNANGRILADSYVYAQAKDSCLIWSYFCPVDRLVETISRNLVSDDVIISDYTQQFVFTIFSPGELDPNLLRETLSKTEFAPPDSGYVKETTDAFLLGGCPWSENGVIFVSDSSFSETLLENLTESGVEFASNSLASNRFEFLRIQGGIVAIPQDLNERNLPQEGKFPVHTVATRKGCFPGQEIMASFRKNGKLSKQIFVISIKGTTHATAPTLPMSVYAGNLKVGEVSSIAHNNDHWIAIALIRLRAINGQLEVRTIEGNRLGLEILQPLPA